MFEHLEVEEIFWDSWDSLTMIGKVWVWGSLNVTQQLQRHRIGVKCDDAVVVEDETCPCHQYEMQSRDGSAPHFQLSHYHNRTLVGIIVDIEFRVLVEADRECCREEGMLLRTAWLSPRRQHYQICVSTGILPMKLQ